MSKIFVQLKKYNFSEKLLIGWGVFGGILGLFLYFLGLISLFYRPLVIIVSLLFLGLLLLFWSKIDIWSSLKMFWQNFKKTLRKDPLILAIIVIFLLFVLVNFIVALAPETGFDALWYHLTLPKIYLATHQIRFIHGGNLYYSVMPRIVEMLYGSALAFNPAGILPKVVHLFFGLSWFFGTYLFCRLFLGRRIALFSALIVYGTALVSSLSQTAYIDLAVAFFVVMSIWAVFRFFKTNDNLDLYLAAIFMGFNLSSKIYGLIIFAIVLGVLLYKSGWKPTLKFSGIAFLIVLPFYFQSYLATGNPIYPVFSVPDCCLYLYTNGYYYLKDWYMYVWWKLLPKLSYQVFVLNFTPILAIIPFIFFSKNWRKMVLPMIILTAFFFAWSLIPIQDPRYFLIILPVVALLTGFIIENLNYKFGRILIIIFALAVLICNLFLISKSYKDHFRVFLGRESRNTYLTKHVAPAFYDSNGFIDRYTTTNDKIWTANIGLRFYLNRPFADFDFDPLWQKHLGSAPEFHQYLKNNGFSYILFGNGTSLTKFTGLKEDDLAPLIQLLYQDDFYKLYKIKCL